MTSVSAQVLGKLPKTRKTKSSRLIPTGTFWFIQDWNKSRCDPSQSYVEGGTFDEVLDFTRENIFSKKNIPIIPKILEAYYLDEEMDEREILIDAVENGLTRWREDFFGKQIFHDYPFFRNMSLERDKEVNLFDIQQIALRHKIASEKFGKALPMNKNIHFFVESLVSSANRLERTLKTSHVLLRVTQPDKIRVTGNEFIHNHKWPKGDWVVFLANKDSDIYKNIENLN